MPVKSTGKRGEMWSPESTPVQPLSAPRGVSSSSSNGSGGSNGGTPSFGNLRSGARSTSGGGYPKLVPDAISGSGYPPIASPPVASRLPAALRSPPSSGAQPQTPVIRRPAETVSHPYGRPNSKSMSLEDDTLNDDEAKHSHLIAPEGPRSLISRGDMPPNRITAPVAATVSEGSVLTSGSSTGRTSGSGGQNDNIITPSSNSPPVGKSVPGAKRVKTVVQQPKEEPSESSSSEKVAPSVSTAQSVGSTPPAASVEEEMPESERMDFEQALQESRKLEVMTDVEMKDARSNASELRTAITEKVNVTVVQALLQDCQRDCQRVQNILKNTQGDTPEIFWDILDDLNEAVKYGREAVKTWSDEFEKLREKEHMFTLICFLRSPEKQTEATLRLMRFVRQAASEDANEHSLILREAILSSGGMHPLLGLFRTRGCVQDLKVTAALTVAYLVPSFIESSTHTPTNLGLRIVECLRFLSRAPEVELLGETIKRKDVALAVADAVHSFWLNYVVPRLSAEALPSDVVPRQSRAMQTGDQRKEVAALRELVEMTVSFIVVFARDNDCQPRTTANLVEQMCAIDSARPLAVREGVLDVLMQWITKSEKHVAWAGAVSLRYLTCINDPYMAGWIHSEIINKGAVEALARISQVEGASTEVAHILARLCVAPHTRAAVVESKCVGILIGFLLNYKLVESSNQEVVVWVLKAIVQLCMGVITRASILGTEDMYYSSMLSSPDKADCVISQILEKGAITSIIQLANTGQGKLCSLAVETLRVLSEDIDPDRETRTILCQHGAVAALGTALGGNLIGEKKNLKVLSRLQKHEQTMLQQAVCALANILDPLQASSSGFQLPSSSDTRNSALETGCIEAATNGGLTAILRIAALSFNGKNLQDSASHEAINLVIFEEACRSLASLSPLLLLPNVAKTLLLLPNDSTASLPTGANDVLNALHSVLTQLVSAVRQLVDSSDPVRTNEVVVTRATDLRDIVLQGLASLCISDALKTRMVDRTLPILIKAVEASDSQGSSSAVSQACQAIGFAQDEVVFQVAGNEPRFVADWFCLQRGLLLQAMARTELRWMYREIWNGDSQGLENQSQEGGVFKFTQDGHLRDSCELLVQQTYEVFGCQKNIAPDDTEQGLLAKQVYPLCSGASETEWILDHRSAMLRLGNKESDDEFSGARPLFSPHVAKMLATCFPSKLLRDQVVPLSDFRLDATFNFRALMMPEKRDYLTFSREARLLSRLYEGEVAACDQEDVHWTIGFANSKFGEEFAAYFVDLLFLCRKIRGLSFVSNKEGQDDRSPTSRNGEEGGCLLAQMACSLPPWVSHLTFDGVLKEQDLAEFVSILENVGVRPGVEDENNMHDIAASAQGKFSFLAVSKSPSISQEVWYKFFGLFYDVNATNMTRPLSSLRSLDLSFNNLGDDLCAKILRAAYQENGGCCLEELDLSGNQIRGATEVMKTLRRVKPTQTKSLHTLVLAFNDLYVGCAWFEIMNTLVTGSFALRVLDLSFNDIDRLEYQHSETVVRFIVGTSTLVRLNLSGNAFMLQAVDDILRQLSAANCTLGFLEIEANDPPLTPQQHSNLRTFLNKSRKLLKDRLSEPYQPPENGSQVEDIPESPADDIAPEPHVQPPSHTDNSITVLISSPLVYQDRNKTFRPFAKLDVEMERKWLWECLSEANRDIELSFDNATRPRLLSTIAKRCKCLHYSGHGHTEYLPFEDGNGGADWFKVADFRDLIVEDNGTAPFRFVFVSACHSGLAGRTFAEAGVPHVVCCQQESEIKDTAARYFTRQFYLALAVGHTVKESFVQGCKAVLAAPDIRNAQEEMKKFILLPEDGNHDEPIFSPDNRGRVVMWENNLIQEDPAPVPPHFFLGREVEMYRVVKQILRDRRVVSIVGESGIGRSSLVCAVCHYINERKNTVSTLIEKIYYVKAKEHKRKSRFESLVRNLRKRLLDDNRLSPGEEEDSEDAIEIVCKGLKNVKALIVFDRLELLEDDIDELSQLPRLIQEICRATRDVKILMTNRRDLGIPSLGEHPVHLGPLNFENTVKLFGHSCHCIVNPADKRQLQESLVTSPEIAEMLPGPDIPDEIRRLFDVLGRGVPSRIENAAFCMHKDDVARLKDGTYFDND